MPILTNNSQDNASAESSAPTQLQAQTPELDTAPTALKGTVSKDVDNSPAPIIGESPEGYAPTSTGYPAVAHLAGHNYLDTPGNIDLSKRQIVDNPENPDKPDPREYGSEYSSRQELPDGRSVSFPTIYDGAVHSPKEAFQHYKDTGEQLATFKSGTPESVMDEYETALHARPITVNGELLTGDKWAAMKGKSAPAPTKANLPRVELNVSGKPLLRQRNNWKIPTNDHIQGTVKYGE